MRLFAIKVNEVIDELESNLEAKGKQLEIRCGKLNLRITLYTKIY